MFGPRGQAAGQISYDLRFFRQSVNAHWVMAVGRFCPRLRAEHCVKARWPPSADPCNLGHPGRMQSRTRVQAARRRAALRVAGELRLPRQRTGRPVDWWRGFGSPELDGYMAQARGASNDIAAAVARVRQADALATVAGAALLPAVGASATAFTRSARRRQAWPIRTFTRSRLK